MSSTSQLTLSSSEFSGLLDFDDIWAGTNSLKQGNSSLCLDKAFDSGGGDDQWNLGDGFNSVTTGKEKCWD